ncbi:MAG: exo-alpha-sialidase [Opitutus sp.]|nr:exo-alpha-sialidase [Opitutus sp.]
MFLTVFSLLRAVLRRPPCYFVVPCVRLVCGLLGPGLFGAQTPAGPVTIPVWDNPAEDSVVYYHIPHILVTRSGILIALAEARHAAGGDGEKTDIVLRRSFDRGDTWSKSQFLERAKGRENYVLPVLIQERRSGRIFFHCSLRNEGLEDRTTENYYRYSDDDGATWSKPVDITSVLVRADRELQRAIREHRAGPEFAGESPELYGRGLFFSGPGRPIQLAALHPIHPHRLAIPMLVIKDRNSPQRNQRGYGNALLISDDAGASWQVAGITPIGDVAASEPSLVELPDGRLLLNTRETPGRDFLAAPAGRTRSVSIDGGATWSRPVVDTSGIPAYSETHSGLYLLSDARTDPAGRSRVLFSYPAGPRRANGTVMLSYDNHESWAVRKLLVAGDFGYSNMDRLPDGTIVLIYENRSFATKEFASRINLVRFSLEWLTDGRDRLTPRTK